jgi:hypothetical protein
MATFDPDAYLATPAPKAAAFDPDAYLSGKPAKPPLKWSDVPLEALKNTPKSAGNLLGGLYQAVTNPIDTLGNVADLAVGGVYNAFPKPLQRGLDYLETNPEAQQRAIGKAAMVGQMYKDRYGSMEGVKNTLATDPVGVAGDVSTVLGVGAAVTPGKLSAALSRASSLTNPLSAVAPIARGVGKVAEPIASNTLGMLTGVGADNVRMAAKSGFNKIPEFMDNLSGKVGMTDVLDSARQNIQNMGAQKSAQYRANMANIKGDKTILNFSGIDKAIKEAFDKVSFKGQIKNQDAAAKLSEAQAIVNNWKQLNPAEFHTPEGIDALKQSVGQILEGLQPRTTSDTVVKGVYNSIKNEINKQAPTYAKTMKSYSESTDLIREIERSLSLNDKASADTAMRKLQSLMRNNVNTNYGQRLKLAQELELAGGRQMMPSLAGQALNELTPRGLQRASTIPTALLAGASGGLPAAAASMLASSPRAMGELAFGAGVGTRGLLDVQRRIPNIDYPTMFNLLYQSQQPKD